MSAKESPDWSLGPYIMQTLLLLVSPALFAASIYMILGRIILVTNGESYSPINRVWLTKLFVLGDVFSFLLQAAGEYDHFVGRYKTIYLSNLSSQVVV